MASTTNYRAGGAYCSLRVYDNHVAGTLTAMAAFRLFRWFNAPPEVGYCTSGLAADGVTGHGELLLAGDPLSPPTAGYLAVRGQPVKVESGGAFAAGANLQSDTSGRAITHASGPVVLRALEASTATGQIIWCVFV